MEVMSGDDAIVQGKLLVWPNRPLGHRYVKDSLLYRRKRKSFKVFHCVCVCVSHHDSIQQ